PKDLQSRGYERPVLARRRQSPRHTGEFRNAATAETPAGTDRPSQAHREKSAPDQETRRPFAPRRAWLSFALQQPRFPSALGRMFQNPVRRARLRLYRASFARTGRPRAHRQGHCYPALPQRRAFLSSRDGKTPTRPPKEPIIACISLRASSRRSLVFVRCSSASRTSALTLVSRSAANRRAARHVFSSIVKFTVFILKTKYLCFFAWSNTLVHDSRSSARLFPNTEKSTPKE